MNNMNQDNLKGRADKEASVQQCDEPPTPEGGTNVVSLDGFSFLIRSELMQNYTTARAIGGAPNLASAVDSNGTVQVFSLNDEGQLFNVFPTKKITTGWGVRLLSDAPANIAYFTIGTEIDGTILVLVCDSDSHIYWKSDEPWSGWTDLGMPFGAMTVKALRTGYGRDGTVIFQAIATLGDQDIVVRIYPRQADNPWDYVSNYITGEIYDCAPGSSALGAGAFVSSNDSLKGNTNVSFYQDHQIQGRTVYENSLDDMVALAGVRDAGGATQIFMLSEQRQAFFVDQLANPAALVPLNESYTGQSLTYVCLQGSRFNTAVDDGADVPLQFFGLCQDGSLYHCRQQYPIPEVPPLTLPDGPGQADLSVDTDSASLPWSPLTLLGSDLQSSAHGLTVCRDSQGYTQCFAVDRNGNLMHFWQDSTTDWKVEPIVINYEGDLREVPSYSTEVTVLDSTGSPVPGQNLQVSASQYLNVVINGVPDSIGPERSSPCATNSAGRITVVTPTGTLGIPSFQVAASILSGGALTIAPDRYIQKALYPDTADDLNCKLSCATYVDQAGVEQPLIDMDTYGDYLPDASQAIWQSMSLAIPQDGDNEAAGRVVSQRGDTDGVAVLPAGNFGNRIDLGKVAAQFWHIEFLDQGVRFHVLRDYAHYREVVDALAVGVPVPPSSFSIHISKPDWGDLWHTIRRGEAALKNIAVAAYDTLETAGKNIVTRIEATIKAAIDGVSQILSYLVDTIQQVFDIAQSVLAALEADFEKVFRWLGTLFDWQSIVQAHTDIKQILNTVFYTQIPQTLSSIEDTVDNFFDRFTTDGIDTGNFGSASFGSGYSDALSQADKAPGPSSNWLQNQVLNSGGGNPAGDVATTSPVDADPLTVFEHKVMEEFGDLYDTLINQFQVAIAEGKSAEHVTPNQVLALVGQMIEQDLLAAAKTVADVAFDLATFVVESTGNVANAPWHIPVVSKLYKEKLGAEMSLLDLTSLALAMPTTVAANVAGLDLALLGKVAHQVALLNQHLTPGQMLGREAIDEATLARLREAGLAEDNATLQGISQILGLVYSFGLLIYAPFSCMYAVGNIKNKWIKAIPVVLSLTVLALSFPLFSGLPETSYDWITIGCWSVAFLLWFSCSALPAIPDFLPPRPLDPERQPLLPKNLPATTGVLDYVTGSVSLVGGVFLLGGYIAQTVVEWKSSCYLPDATPEFKDEEVVLKGVQNCLGVLPTIAQPLKWTVFDEYGGKGILGVVSVFGLAGAGACGLIRDALNIDEGQTNHII